jgi:uncharacterized damage-inducible protein DinB
MIAVVSSRQRPPGDADERAMLCGWLDWQRATVRLKCTGVSDDDAQRALLPTSPTMTIAGLVSHLRWVEHGWFEAGFLGLPNQSPTGPDAEWRAPGVPLAQLLDEYDAQCTRSREITAAHPLDQLEAHAPPGLELVSLRWIVSHLLEETARHLGHLDLLREQTDGTTGS